MKKIFYIFILQFLVYSFAQAQTGVEWQNCIGGSINPGELRDAYRTVDFGWH